MERSRSWPGRRITGPAVAAAVFTAIVAICAVAAFGGRSATSPALIPAGPAAIPVRVPAGTDCGRHVLHHAGITLPDSAIACFLDAVRVGRPAHLAETRPTVEGDPIHTLYTADATGAVQVTRDTRADAFGTRGITRQTCTGPFADQGHIGFAGCSPPDPI